MDAKKRMGVVDSGLCNKFVKANHQISSSYTAIFLTYGVL